MSNIAILLGAGGSSRMGITIQDKILAKLCGKPVFAYSIEAFIKCEIFNTLTIVYKDNLQKSFIETYLDDHFPSLAPSNILWVQGGRRRQDSVYNALKILPQKTHHVFIHDLARPLIHPKILNQLYQTLLTHESAVLAHPVTDTIKQIDQTKIANQSNTFILNDLNRNTLWAMETPQAFEFSLICKAYEEIQKRNLEITDEATAVSLLNHPITLINNDSPNPKITVYNDLHFIEYLLMKNEHLLPL